MNSHDRRLVEPTADETPSEEGGLQSTPPETPDLLTDRRKLARALLPEILAELEKVLFTLLERSRGQSSTSPSKRAVYQILLEIIWEMEEHPPDLDEGLESHSEITQRYAAERTE